MLVTIFLNISMVIQKESLRGDKHINVPIYQVQDQRHSPLKLKIIPYGNYFGTKQNRFKLFIYSHIHILIKNLVLSYVVRLE